MTNPFRQAWDRLTWRTDAFYRQDRGIGLDLEMYLRAITFLSLSERIPSRVRSRVRDELPS